MAKNPVKNLEIFGQMATCFWMLLANFLGVFRQKVTQIANFLRKNGCFSVMMLPFGQWSKIFNKEYINKKKQIYKEYAKKSGQMAKWQHLPKNAKNGNILRRLKKK